MFSERIRELRKSKNISQVELGKHIGVTKQSISNWENDNIQPSIEMLLKLAEYFSVSTDYILGVNDKKILDVSKLTDDEVAHIRLIISDITKNKP